MPIISCAFNAVPSALRILHFAYKRLLRKSMYSFPWPGMEISIGASSVLYADTERGIPQNIFFPQRLGQVVR